MGIYRVGANGSAPKGLQANDLVVTGGGTYKIDEVKPDGTYSSSIYNKDQTTYNYTGAYDRAPDSTQVQVQQNIQQGAASGNAASAFSSNMNNYASQIKNYSDPYASQIAAQNNKVQNYGEFTYEPYSYDQRSDIRAANVKQTGTREIRRAVEDTLGNYAANTGGQASTAAVSAAAQAGDYYAAQLTDQLNDVENEAYARWSADRDFAYNKWYNQFNVELSKLSALQSLSDSDFDRFLSQLTTAAELEGTAFQANFEMATMAAQYGDYSLLNQMGVDTTAYQKAQASDAAAAAGMTGLYYKVGADGYAPEGMSVGDYVVTNGGTYMVTGYNSDGSYQSKLVDKQTTPGNFIGYYANASNPNYVDPYTVALTGGGSSSGSGGSSSRRYYYDGGDDYYIDDGPVDNSGQRQKVEQTKPKLREATPIGTTSSSGGSMGYNDLARWLGNNANSVTVQEAKDKINRNANNLTDAQYNALMNKYIG